MSEPTAPSMGDVLGNAGEPVSITANGKTWKVAYPTPAAIDRVEKLIAAAYVAEVAALEDDLPPADFESLRSGMRTDLAARIHRAGGPLWAKTLATPAGSNLYLLALLRHHHPDATEADVVTLRAAAGVECDAALELVSPFFFEAVARKLGKTPEQAAADAVKFRERVAARKAAAGSSS